ncbi:hypothetical protein [Erythrobacter sp. JK5]|uniref:hypothetical protein n=1 Tax=Erythrobacter sp. JK5 TaxID=2829500 RepID=UPI001BAB96E0|nr:hypothetical protein [Erythrobacter sp. JK5]QUL37667.1 hypothetical protein KDC96_15180 [Erythrobacter sp. JK5]
MSWLGLGLVSQSSPVPRAGDLSATAPPAIAPSAAWNGSEGSGFAALPADPERTTAKPALRLITPPKQHFTDTLDVGVMAAANDRGSLFEALGLAGVTFHFEGTSVTLAEPRWHSLIDANGEVQTYYGWWVRLRKPPQRSGYAHLYVEATPRDATMQSRVIGPYVFAPQAARHDGLLSVAPSAGAIAGSRYPTIREAIQFGKSQGWQNYRIALTEPGTYDMGDDPPNAWDQKGWVEIVAATSGCAIGLTEYTTDAAAKISPGRSPIRLIGRDLTLDFRHLVEINSFDTNFWCDGITITTSDPRGRFETLRGGAPDQLGWRIRGGAWFTECDISEVSGACGTATLVRGCTLANMTYDVFGDIKCCVHNTLDNHRGGFWYTDHPCVAVQYAGAEATATLERDGTADASLATWTARWGTNVATFECGNQESYYTGATGDGYTFADLVAWLDGLPGWSASLTDPEFATIRCCAGSIAGEKGRGLPATDCKTAPLTLVAMFDRHGDFYQPPFNADENVIIAFNRAWEMQTQTLFLSPNPPGAILRDILIFGNALHNSETVEGYYDPDANSSQFGRGTGAGLSHLVIVHNSANQRWRVRNDEQNNTADTYCLIANNVAKDFVWAGGQVLANLKVDAMHLFDGAIKPSGATRIALGGNESSLFANASGGDFTPVGGLLASGFAPILPHDIAQGGYPPIAAPGAIAANAAVFVDSGGPSGSGDPFGDLLALIDAAGGRSSIHDYTLASDVPPWTSPDRSANGNQHLQATGSRKPALGTNGATFDGNNDFVSQAINGGLFTVAMAIMVNDPADPGAILSDEANTTYVQYQAGNTASHFATAVQVDGVVTTTRGDLHDAVNGAGEVVLMIEGVDFSGRSELRIGRGSGAMNATVRRVAVIEESAFPGNLQQVRQLAAEAVALT